MPRERITEPRTLSAPTQCVLWDHPERAAAEPRDAMFETVERLVDEDEVTRLLLRCRECGQVYVFEYYYDSRRGTSYTTGIPVSDPADIEMLQACSIYELSYFTPRLQWDYRADKRIPEWIGK